MSERHELPKIKPTEAPSIVNQNAGVWGFLTAGTATLINSMRIRSGVQKIIIVIPIYN